MKRKKRYVIILLLLLIFLVSGGYLLWKNLDYQKGAENYTAAAEAAGLPPPPEQVPSPEEPAVPSGEEAADPRAVQLADLDLDALRAANSDVIGWIDIPETELSYPILQGADNDYYLDHTWNGERSSVGAIFMERQCAADFSDFKTILYGHRMRNGSMFGMLRNYTDLDFWAEHPKVYIADEACVRIYDIFAAFEVSVREIVYRLDLEETGQEQACIDFCLANSDIDTGIIPDAGSGILVLSTCTGRGHATRWVVLGTLVETYQPERG